ncbi:MAG TPA: glycoside hydrolase family 2 TIM barrel-domain containing protein [Sunxiuqinia sp.]|nr:glycoside hydrolase family 2 TIM barrel-domain containing protein [Sunxiuqinia sp.]
MKLLPIFLIFLAGLQLHAQTESSINLIQNPDGRKSISLDGNWHYILDPYQTGYLDYRLKPTNEGFAQNAKAKKESDRVEYNFAKTPTLHVPGDWNTQNPVLLYYEGTLWYQRDFNLKKDPNQRYFVYFGAVNYECHVWVNGKKAGQHVGGFTSFDFEITDLLHDGDNFIVVMADNTRKRDAVPTVNTDWWNYGGITRSVRIIETPKTFIRDYYVQLAKGDSKIIKGWVQLDGMVGDKMVDVSIPEAGINKKVEVADDGFASFEIDRVKLDLWSPQNPKLYEVIVKSKTDEVHDQIGFRTIEVDGNNILLNGKSIFLRGVCMHEEAPFRSGRAHSVAEARTVYHWAKEMDCNFMRLAHYSHRENMVKEGDREGMLLWAENPVYWTILWNNPDTYANAEHQLAEMITRDKNRASIIIWSMANETPLSDARLKFISGLVDKARSLDNTRLISAALEVYHPKDRPNVVILEDPLAKYLDIYGCNEYYGWYAGFPEAADNITWEMKYNKPLVITEFGGGALYNYHGSKKTRWTEEYQEDVYKHNLKMLDKIPFLRGTAPWILMDFRSPKRVLTGIQDGYNRKGLISDQGQKKKAFWVMKDFYEKKEREYQNK